VRPCGLLAGGVALLVAVCAAEASAEREWAVTLLGGQYSGNKLLKDSYATGLSVSYQFVDWGPHMRWELEGQVLKHLGEQEHVELVASPWSMVARLHHRSGIFGLFSHSGSNLLELGLRYRF